ncbi:MAG: MFS transporter [Planctomyces sp.]
MDNTDEIHRTTASGHYTLRSTAFWSFLCTQFLGAFNDNYFKQMVLLTCVGAGAAAAQNSAVATDPTVPGLPWKEIAMAAFALPFVLFSGLGGFLSDRLSKTSVIAGCKLAEIGIVGIGLAILLIPGLSTAAQLSALIFVLALMGTHSAIFSPSKYGVLPELFRADCLLPVNGAVQMTTFLAIIFGTVCAGIALDLIRSQLWISSLVALLIATAGSASSLLIPRIAAADPQLLLRFENLALPRSVLTILFRDRHLLRAVLVYSLFWFLGGVVQMGMNTLGEASLQLSKTRTSVLVAGIGFGIAVGCLLAGLAGRGSRRWTVIGAWLLTLALAATALLGSGQFGKPASAGRAAGEESITASLFACDLLEWLLRADMVVLGIAAGLFVVPVQVFLQAAPPSELKGRVLGVQNLMTWIGILLSAAFSLIVGISLKLAVGPDADKQHQWVLFALLAAMMLPVAAFYRLPDRSPVAAQTN